MSILLFYYSKDAKVILPDTQELEVCMIMCIHSYISAQM